MSKPSVSASFSCPPKPSTDGIALWSRRAGDGGLQLTIPRYPPSLSTSLPTASPASKRFFLAAHSAFSSEHVQSFCHVPWEQLSILEGPNPENRELVPLLIGLSASVGAESSGHGAVGTRISFRAMAASVLAVLLLLTCSLGFGEAVGGGLVLELASHTLSLGSDAHKLEVFLTSSDGSPATSASVTLISALSVATGSPVSLSEHQKFASLGDGKYELAVLSSELSLGKYKVRIDADGGKGYLTSVVAVTAPISVSNGKAAVLDGDGVESSDALEIPKTVALSASHAQKLKVSFELRTPSGAPFKAQQVLLKLRHIESGGEEVHLVLPSTTLGYERTLDFSKMGEKLKHQSGAYAVELIVGDDVMENSFIWNVASLDLDLPEGPEETKADASPSKFAPKAEIGHIFRQPEKRPPAYLSMIFLILTLIPLVGFFVGLQQLGVNLKGLPSSGLPLAAAAGFHGGIAMILGLYLLFWLKLNLFTTLQVLGFLGLFTLVPGFHILSHLADNSTKVKSA